MVSMARNQCHHLQPTDDGSQSQVMWQWLLSSATNAIARKQPNSFKGNSVQSKYIVPIMIKKFVTLLILIIIL